MQKTQPSLNDVLKELQRTIGIDTNCHKIGRITAYDTSKNTVEVQLVDNMTIENEGQEPTVTERSLLVEVPLVIIGGGTSGELTFPDPTGCDCLVCFNDRDLDNWFFSGDVSVPQSERTHHIMDGIAIVGLRSLNNPLADYDANATTLRKGKTKLVLKDNEATLTNGTVTVTIVGDAVTVTCATAQIVAATSINLNTPVVEFAGVAKIPVLQLGSSPLGIDGNEPTFDFNTSGDVKAGGKSLKQHQHPYTWTAAAGSGNTGAPN